MVKVSVIIPVYNGAATICQSIDSVLGQTLKDIEIIVVNDGSTDSTGALLKGYGDRIKVITVKNGGQGRARNIAMEKASGEYFGFVDADDTIEREMYEKMYKTAKAYNAQIVQCAMRDITEEKGISVRSAFDENVEITDRADYVFSYFYKTKHTNEVCNKLIERRFIQDNGFKFSDTKAIHSEDFLLNMEMMLKLQRISFVSGAYYNYYIKNSGHYRSDLSGRTGKILRLFDILFEHDMEKDVRLGFECNAALTLLIYTAQAIESAEKVLKDERMQRYIKASMTYRSSLRHSLLMAAMLYSPMWVKKILLKKFFIFE